MYFLSRFCCVCLCDKNDLRDIFAMDSDGLSEYNKLTSSIPEMDFKELNDQRLICGECCVTLNTVYNFRRTCLRSKKNLITYISQIQTFGNVRGTLCVRLTDIKQEIKVENELKNDCMNNCIEDVTKYENDLHTNISIKNEYEEEYIESYFTNNNSTIANSNEQEYRGNNIEFVDVNNRTDNGDHKLAEVKEEYLAERPEDGSTRNVDRTDIMSSSRKNYLIEPNEERYEAKPPKQQIYNIVNQFHSQQLQVNSPTFQRTSDKLYQCTICNKTFVKKVIYDTHMRVHSGEKPYECEVCHKKFTQKGNHTKHVRLHLGEKPFECNVCKKKFSEKSAREIHERIHTGEKPYQCNVCSKRFSDKSYLGQHVRWHAGNTPYQCEICQKHFIHKGALNVHNRSHTGERPYECDVCKKRYIKKSDLNAHMFKHSSNKYR